MVADIVSDFTGIYARVARKLDVSQSLVSKVAHGHRVSPKIDNALRQELKAFKDKLRKFV
jgi:hypothetical protein